MGGPGNFEYVWARAAALAPPSLGTLLARDPSALGSLRSLAGLVCPGLDLAGPRDAGRLAGRIQEEVLRRTLAEGRSLVGALAAPVPLLTAALGIFDLRWLKQAWAAVLGRRALPVRPALGPGTLLGPGDDPATAASGTGFRYDPDLPVRALPEAFRALDRRYFGLVDAGVRAAGGDGPLVRFAAWEAGPGTDPADPALGLRARTLFHTHPASAAGLYGYLRWRSSEAFRVCRAAEALALGLPEAEVRALGGPP